MLSSRAVSRRILSLARGLTKWVVSELAPSSGCHSSRCRESPLISCKLRSIGKAAIKYRPAWNFSSIGAVRHCTACVRNISSPVTALRVAAGRAPTVLQIIKAKSLFFFCLQRKLIRSFVRVLALFIEAQLFVRRSEPIPQSTAFRETAHTVVVDFHRIAEHSLVHQQAP